MNHISMLQHISTSGNINIGIGTGVDEAAVPLTHILLFKLDHSHQMHSALHISVIKYSHYLILLKEKVIVDNVKDSRLPSLTIVSG